MFLEPRFRGQRSGWIEIVTGCMFSGKTEELLRRIKRSKIAGQSVILFKPARDTRYHDTNVVSHDENSMDSVVISKARDMMNYMDQYEVIGVDEAQFFDQDLVQVCEELALEGKRIIAAGLDLDFKGRPFGPIPHLLAVSEYVTKVHAICPHCGNLATHSYRLSQEQATVLLGEKDHYEPRCRKCYSMGNILQLRVRK